jgi:hypothetical protein
MSQCLRRLVLEVKAATDYDLFSNTSKIDEEMDVLRLQTDSKAKEQLGFQNAAAAFANAVTLEKGLSEIAHGRDGALDEDLKTSNELKRLIETRWRSLRKYQNDYHARHTAPGNAHNYGQRAELLLQVLTVLLDEALARAAALATGIYRIYGVKIPDVPTRVTLQTVDPFAVWALRTIRSLSHAAEQEMTSEIVIPLVQPWLPTQVPLIKADGFNEQKRQMATRSRCRLIFLTMASSIVELASEALGCRSVTILNWSRTAASIAIRRPTFSRG